MGYVNFQEFRTDFKATWVISQNDKNIETAMLSQAWKIYRHGLEQGAADGLTVGLIPNLQDHLATGGSVFDGGTIFVDPTSMGRWKIYLNDCFILGGVHSHGDFTLVGLNSVVNDPTLVQGPGQLDHVRDPQANFPLKVTQREVLGITRFGYTGGDIDNDGMRTFTCNGDENEALADRARLWEYRAFVDLFTLAL